MLPSRALCDTIKEINAYGDQRMHELTRNQNFVNVLTQKLKNDPKSTIRSVEDTRARISTRLESDVTTVIHAILQNIPSVSSEYGFISQQVPNSHRSLFTESGLGRIESRSSKIEESVKQLLAKKAAKSSFDEEKHAEYASSVIASVQNLRKVTDFYRDALENMDAIEEDIRARKNPDNPKMTYIVESIYEAARPSLAERESHALEVIKEDLGWMMDYLSARDSEEHRHVSTSCMMNFFKTARSMDSGEIRQLIPEGAKFNDDPRSILPDNSEQLLQSFASSRMDAVARSYAKKVGKRIFESVRTLPSTFSFEATSTGELSVDWNLKGEKKLNVEGYASVGSDPKRGLTGSGQQAETFSRHRDYVVDVRSIQYKKGNKLVTEDHPTLNVLKDLPKKMESKPRHSLSGNLAALSLGR